MEIRLTDPELAMVRALARMYNQKPDPVRLHAEEFGRHGIAVEELRPMLRAFAEYGIIEITSESNSGVRMVRITAGSVQTEREVDQRIADAIRRDREERAKEWRNRLWMVAMAFVAAFAGQGVTWLVQWWRQ